MKAVDEELIKTRFVTMWNKLQNSYKELLYPIVETLERTKVSCETKEKIENLENQIAELSKQSRLLNQAMAKQCIDSAFYMEQQNIISKNLKEYQRAKEQCLRKSRQRKELKQTKELVKQLKKGPQYLEVYDKTLFQAIVKQIIVNPNELVFQLKNGLQLTERREKV